jgi:molybdopterin synthase catalytic subunit
MRVTVRLFGSVRDEIGAKELSVALEEGAAVMELRALLARQHPSLERLGDRLRMAVNHVLAPEDAVLRDGDEVALLPPVSGGSAPISLSHRPLDVAEVIRRVAGPDAGGIVTFLGTVRDRARGREIRRLEYEAYGEMAQAEMERIAAEAARRWPGARVAMAHRTGNLVVGDIAVVVVAAAPHRVEAFEACRFAIDALKRSVPIWKKEIATDGGYWVEDHA